MSSELRIKKLRGSGGYVMARVTDEQQMKGNLGGPDLFLAPIGRLDADKISKHFCNTCEKEFEGAPKIEFENPNEEVAENLILAERGQYICNTCESSIAEYREFKKQDEAGDVGNAKPIEPQTETAPQVEQPQQVTESIPQPVEQPKIESSQETATRPSPATSVSSIEGRSVYDENANKIGIAKQVGIDSTQSMVLVITQNDGTEGSIPWKNIKKVGEVILLGNPEEIAPPGKCSNCGFSNKEGSKFCEECGTPLQ
ncbi:zinc-ribbon domain-containing protein [Candidatus Nitrosopumilus sp. SW]|uniref:zinc-ribbon domain-containing protein n=1 Tax=Candidatus Nitrosopumilus sp. SW TaxID=2508726 RepID=UPI00114E462F|nr:zinc-ribbon domain-containing protein [Candidatus Nitrosopumilus sp. SW]QDI88729.1 zinc-ribbon domain-containing protein [Candidatus Nitrosopumilus sp. SW]